MVVEPRAAESEGDLQELLDSALSGLVEAAGGAAGLMQVWDDEADPSVRTSTWGMGPEVADALREQLRDVLSRVEALGAGALVDSWGERAGRAAVQTSGGPLEFVTLPLRHGGRLVGVLALLDPSPATGLPGGRAGLYQAIIDRMDAALENASLVRRLWQEKRWLEAVIQHSADGILIVDAAGRIVGFNRALVELSGWEVAEARPRPCHEIFRLEYPTGEGFRFFDPAGPGDPPRDQSERAVELVLVRRDGRRISVELTYSAIRTEGGQLLGGMAGVRDITARKEAEELQSTFLSVVSHELQTPVAIIKGYAGLLKEDLLRLSTDQLCQNLDVITEEAERLSKMVENLLLASRIQAGGIGLSRDAVDLPSLVKRVARKLEGVSAPHQLRVEVPDHLPAVMADYERIQQVLINLVENAVKYSPPGGTITVHARATNAEVVVSVLDQGAGVPESQRERIFDRFARLDSRLPRHVKGTGLGLFICKSIVEAHGGRIWVEPRPEGGSCFSFSLPRECPAQLPALFWPSGPGQ